jgi:hypothetical protein
VRIGVGGRVYHAHRLAWLYVHGVWPAGDIDHINGDPLDNRLCNLRLVDRSVNMQNQRRARADSHLGVLGVSARGGRFRASIAVRGERFSLGTFDDVHAAQDAYVTAKRRLHEGCTI